MEGKSMTAAGGIATSNKIKEQYEKHKKFVGTLFLFFKKENLC